MEQVINIKRIYESPLKKDGIRILVDRLWPRGVTKEDAAIDDWEKELAPSTKLRTWYGHTPKLWPAFQKMYNAELNKNKAVDSFLKKYSRAKAITLVYAAKDEDHTHALVLQEYLKEQFNALHSIKE